MAPKRDMRQLFKLIKAGLLSYDSLDKYTQRRLRLAYGYREPNKLFCDEVKRRVSESKHQS